MSRNLARGLFLIGVAVLASLLVLVICQVPQPWRGVLACWLLFLSTGGAFILRVLKHYAQIKAAQAARPASERSPRSQTPRKSKPATGSLRVIASDTATGSGRYIL